MTLGPLLRRVGLALALGSLLFLAWNGLVGGVDQLSASRTPGQKAQTFTQFGYGLCSALGVITTFGWRRWRTPILACWTAFVSAAGGLAPVVWGGSGLGTGFLAGGAALLIAVVIILMLRAGAPAQPNG